MQIYHAAKLSPCLRMMNGSVQLREQETGKISLKLICWNCRRRFKLRLCVCLLVLILTVYYSFLVLFKPYVSWSIHIKPVQMHFKTTEDILEYVAVQVFSLNAWDLPLLKLGALNKIESSWLVFDLFLQPKNKMVPWITLVQPNIVLGFSLLEIFHIYMFVKSSLKLQ